MNDSTLEEIVAITDALLQMIRSPEPNLRQAEALLRERGKLIALLPPANAAEREARRQVLLRIAAADAEIRFRVERRIAQMNKELQALAQRGHRSSQRSAVPRLIDYRA
jgi:hypothetical protein